MISIAKGQTLSTTGTVLDVFLTDPSLGDALLRDPVALSFALYLEAGDQIYPSSDIEDVDLVADKLGKGHYCATFLVPAGAPVGPAKICWAYEMPSGFEGEIVVPVEIVSSTSLIRSGYSGISDVRAEGVLPYEAGDDRVSRSIFSASQLIERITERWFMPRHCTFTIDGTGNRVLDLPAPIIAIESVTVALDGSFAGLEPMDPTGFRAYARHVTEGMVEEDDRQCPRLVLDDCSVLARVGVDFGVWPRGRKNIQVQGVFGYTDYDGSPTGKTPELIREVCTTVAIARTEKIALRSPASGPVTMEKTRDQEIQYSDAGLGGAFTGDSEIDMLLESFRRPPTFSAA